MDTAASTSLWHTTSPAPPTTDELPTAAEIVVAGAGLAGIVTALLLARAGHDVVVLDAASPGARTTGGSTAKLSLLQGSIYSDLRDTAGDESLRAYGQAQLAAREWLLEECVGRDDLFEQRTAFTYVTDPERVSLLRSEAEASALAGIEVEELRAEPIGLPFDVAATLRLRNQAALHPMRIIDALGRRAIEYGASLIAGCRLEGADDDDDGLILQTSKGPIRTRRLVVTTGFPVIDRRGFFAKLVPSRQFVGVYRLPEPSEVPQDMYVSLDPVGRSLRSAVDEQGERVLLVGGDSFVPGRDDATHERLEAMDAWAAEHFPHARRERWWGAQDYAMVDDRPFFGPMPGTDGRILAATGFAKWGMTNAVAAALSIAGAVDGASPEWAAPFAEAGIGPGGWGSMAGAGAAVAKDMAAGWVSPAESHETDAASATVRRDGVTPVAESTVDGVACAVSAVCTHMGGIVRWNTAERSWDCPLHGSRFAPDGTVLEGPATKDLPPVDADEGADRHVVGTDPDLGLRTE